MRLFNSLTTLLLISICSGCTSSTNTDISQANQPTLTIDVIIKFENSVKNPESNHFVTQLNQRSHLKLVFKKPLSGNAWLYQVQTTDNIKNTLKKLNTLDDVVYAELDKSVKGF